MKYTTIDEVNAIHDMILQRYGGGRGCTDSGKVAAFVTRVQNLAFYENVTDIF